MMTVLRSICMAFSMFSKIPVPMVKWKKENMKYMLCALPLVGLVIGFALIGWNALCEWLHTGKFLYGAGMTLIPLSISGAIHMDGFADTVDALSSHAEPERKREILKDSHAGAFAIIFTAAYLIFYFACSCELNISITTGLCMMLIHILSRCCGAFAGIAFPSSQKKGLLYSFKEASSKKAVLILAVSFSACCMIMIFLFPILGIICAASSLLLLFYMRKMSEKEFGGMSGDLAGYLITLSELVFIICFTIITKVVNII